MTGEIFTLLLSLVGTLLALTVAGIFIRRGTVIRSVDVMEKVITAYEAADRLDEKRRTALAEQLAATQLERDALKVQIAAAQVRVADLERATGTWVLERTELLARVSSLQAQNASQERRIAALEGKTP